MIWYSRTQWWYNRKNLDSYWPGIWRLQGHKLKTSLWSDINFKPPAVARVIDKDDHKQWRQRIILFFLHQNPENRPPIPAIYWRSRSITALEYTSKTTRMPKMQSRIRQRHGWADGKKGIRWGRLDTYGFLPKLAPAAVEKWNWTPSKHKLSFPPGFAPRWVAEKLQFDRHCWMYSWNILMLQVLP